VPVISIDRGPALQRFGAAAPSHKLEQLQTWGEFILSIAYIEIRYFDWIFPYASLHRRPIDERCRAEA
jgi:hypothetical protein